MNFSKEIAELFFKRILLSALPLFLIASYLLDIRLIVLISVAIALFIAVCKDASTKIQIIYFTLPFSIVLKLSPESFSFYTLFLFTYVASELFHRKIINKKVIATIGIYTIYLIITNFNIDNTQLSYLIKSPFYLLIFYYIIDAQKNIPNKRTVIALAYGLLTSCIIGLFSENIPNLLQHLSESQIKNELTQETTARFSGLWNDPNLFSTITLVSISSALVCITCSTDKTVRFKFEYFLVLSFICFFGFLTLSKTYILGIIIITISNLHKITVKFDIKIVFLISSLIVSFTYFIPSEVIDVYVTRLSDFLSPSSTSSELTTGRTEIWEKYLDFISFKNSWLIGEGIGAPYPFGRASHNTIIEIIYRIGLIGLIILFTSLIFIYSLNKTTTNKSYHESLNLNKYIPISILIYCSLSLDLLRLDITPILLAITTSVILRPTSNKLAKQYQG